ncbi:MULTISPECIES: PACE efflux transporter [unclassified Pseudomonas]|uniref:PACE efflux transporter n=1 Tax=unclassified Pseudomonas TaxID=196821 RepID=UPI00119D1EB8|nr:MULTISPECIES: PACE efflux transporter [unclassified Pseudomonas]
MQGVKRKLVYVTFYELIGLCMSTLGLAYLSNTQASHTGPLAVLITSIAMLWNLIYNSLFERWESGQTKRGRSVARRVAHAIGFQLTLVVYLIPLIAWWLDMTLVEAFVVDLAFIILVPCYTFAYNWAFDRIFGLPTAAMARA